MRGKQSKTDCFIQHAFETAARLLASPLCIYLILRFISFPGTPHHFKKHDLFSIPTAAPNLE